MSKMIENKTFVEIWMSAFNNHQSAKWVANYLKITRVQCHSKAGYLRKQGVKLPKLVYSAPRMNDEDIGTLNKIIRDMENIK